MIQTPAGRYALIDGGPSPGRLAESLGRFLPAGAQGLDLVVAASPEGRSLDGLPGLLDRLDIGRAIQSGSGQKSAAYRQWVDGLAARGVPQGPAEAGQQFDLGGGARLTLVDSRASGATIRIEYGRAAFLFPIGLDARAATELAVRGALAPATVVLAPRGGGKDALSALFLDAVQPATLVISTGAGQPPDPGTLLLFAGRTVLRTDEHGAISFATDGSQLWVETER